MSDTRERLEREHGATVTKLHRRRLTDDGDAYRIVDLHGDDLRYVTGAGWHAWDGTRWLHDASGETLCRARELARLLHADADRERGDEQLQKALKQHAKASSSRRGLEAMLWIARSDTQVLTEAAAVDADPLLLNAPNGTIDLSTGMLRQHERVDLLTRRVAVPYDPEAWAPTWGTFLERVLPDDRLRKYAQRMAGGAAVGNNANELPHVLYGVGANGKTKFCETIRACLGDYAAAASVELFLADRSNTPRGPSSCAYAGSACSLPPKRRKAAASTSRS